jgi:predicted nucleic acid-binding protein
LRRVVLDASVAAKWLLPSATEPYSQHALRLLDEYVNREIEILIPDLFWAEIANVLWKAARAGRCTPEQARIGLEKVTVQRFPTVRSRSLLSSAFDIASTSGRTVYDCLYIALAEASRSEFLTADERLVNATGTRYPVKWLGAL